MTLYEIDGALAGLVDPETGEIADYDKFTELAMEREKKLENVALWIKNLRAEISAIKDEIGALTERKKRAERQAERLVEYLSEALDGEKMETPRVSIRWRKSTGVSVDDGFIPWAEKNAPELLNYGAPKPLLSEIWKRINSGEKIPHAGVEERKNLMLK